MRGQGAEGGQLIWQSVSDPQDWPEVRAPEYLIQGLLSSSLTSLAGDPGAGKTYLAIGMADALLNGESDFLGCPVLTRLERVAILTTDANGAPDVRKRAARATRGGGMIYAVACPLIDMPWADVTAEIVLRGIQLVIIDNVMGFSEDPNDVVAAKHLSSVFLDWHRLHGVATLMLTHTAKPGASGPAHGVNAAYGSRYWTVPARVKARLTFDRRSQRRQVTTVNNDSEGLCIDASLSVEEGYGTWSCIGGSRREPSEKATSWADALAAQVVKEQPTEDNISALSQRYAKCVGKSPETVRPKLRSRVRHVEGVWELIVSSPA